MFCRSPTNFRWIFLGRRQRRRGAEMGKREKRKTRAKAKRARGGQREGAARAWKTGDRDGNDYLELSSSKTSFADLLHIHGHWVKTVWWYEHWQYLCLTSFRKRWSSQGRKKKKKKKQGLRKEEKKRQRMTGRVKVEILWRNTWRWSWKREKSSMHRWIAHLSEAIAKLWLYNRCGKTEC